MLATIIADAFKKGEEHEIAKALDDLCSPIDRYGWASAGIYSFWDVQSKEIYYIGLAVDLANRFRQHTGLLPCNPNGCKVQQITDHFENHEYLGYSIFVQSPLSQVVTAQLAERIGVDEEDLIDKYEDIAQQGYEEIRVLEGFLIEAHARQHARPKWNKVGGSRKGQAIRFANEAMLLDCLTCSDTGPILARSSLR